MDFLKVPVYLNIRYITFIGCHLPVIGVIYCLSMSMLHDRDRTDSKYCGVNRNSSILVKEIIKKRIIYVKINGLNFGVSQNFLEV